MKEAQCVTVDLFMLRFNDESRLCANRWISGTLFFPLNEVSTPVPVSGIQVGLAEWCEKRGAPVYSALLVTEVGLESCDVTRRAPAASQAACVRSCAGSPLRREERKRGEKAFRRRTCLMMGYAFSPDVLFPRFTVCPSCGTRVYPALNCPAL